MRPTNRWLVGKTLVWVTYDPGRSFSAAVRGMLAKLIAERGWQLDLHEASNLASAAVLVEQRRASLLTLVSDAADFSGLCKSLRRVQLFSPDCVRLVYAPRSAGQGSYPAEQYRLVEVGAQIVVDQIPWVHQVLPAVVDLTVPRAGGCHPITAGLVEALPWGNMGMENP